MNFNVICLTAYFCLFTYYVCYFKLIAGSSVCISLLMVGHIFCFISLISSHGLQGAALSIARRESEFNEAVISSADARGLMQVLPATGRQTARRMGVEFDETRLTTDGAYNATLGAGYLEEMMAEFGNTLPLVAAGYNAGPGRPRRWVTEFGDPRNADTDPIDWVEFIPFTETRNYVMRVAEAVVLYRAILAGEPGPIRLTDILRGRG